MTAVGGQEAQDLLQFFYQCPVGLTETDDAGTVERMNPAAVRMLAPVVTGDRELIDLATLFERVLPAAAAALRTSPERLGRLDPDVRHLIPVEATPGQLTGGIEVQLVRFRPGRVMVTLVDASNELGLRERENARTRQLQQRVLQLAGTQDAAAGPLEQPLDVIVETIAEFAGADLVLLAFPVSDSGGLEVAAASGTDRGAMIGRPLPVEHDPYRSVLNSGRRAAVDLAGRPQSRTGLPPRRYGPALVLPLAGEDGGRGLAVLVRRADRLPFGITDTQHAETFAANAPVAYALADAVARRDQLAGRERQARVLHDELIQSLFATGLHLQAIAYAPSTPENTRRLARHVDTLDMAIARLRETLSAAPPDRPGRVMTLDSGVRVLGR